eukprot:355253-Chlamydomonas_euryale.AAC.1
MLTTGDSGVQEAFTNHFETLLGGKIDICETAMQCLGFSLGRRLLDDRLTLRWLRAMVAHQTYKRCMRALRLSAAMRHREVTR